MKKNIILILVSILNYFCIALTSSSDNKEWIFGFLFAENGSMICDFTYNFNNEIIELELGSSGFVIQPTFVNENDDALEFGFYKIWIGAEEIDKEDNRKVSYYKVLISQENIEHSKNGVLKEILNIQPVLVLEDSTGSVERHYKNYKDFTVKECCTCYERNDFSSNIVKQLKLSDTFFILDIVSSEVAKNDIWLKIDVNSTIGYIPLSALADDWKVIKNKLDTFVDVNNIPAFCNDDRVRIRKEPSLDCETLGYLNKNDKVVIKDHSEKKTRIENKSFYWYKVELPDGKSGWVYGKYLDIEE